MEVVVEVEGRDDESVRLPPLATLRDFKVLAHLSLGPAAVAVPVDDCVFRCRRDADLFASVDDDATIYDVGLLDGDRVELVLPLRHITRRRLADAGVVDAATALDRWHDALATRALDALEMLIVSEYVPSDALRDAVFAAAEHGDDALLAVLLAHLAEPTRRDPATALDLSLPRNGVAGKTVLTAAVERSHGACVRLLVEHGAAVNAGGHMPCPTLADGGASEIMEYLKTPLMHAAEKGHTDIIRYLVAHGADVCAADDGGLSPLLYALQEGHFEAGMVLLESGANVNVKDHVWMKTPLMYAVEQEQLGFAAWLLENGALVDARDCSGGTALIYAAQQGTRGSLALAELLLRHGADVNARDHRKRTPLMWAAHAGQVDVAEHLVTCGADIAMADIDDNTPLACATSRGHLPIVRFIMKTLVPGPPKMGDWVADAVLAKYEGLPPKGKPQGGECTIVAGLVARDASGAAEVVALGTGSGCVSASRLTPCGNAVTDGHAEVVCRRAFLRHLYTLAEAYHTDSAAAARALVRVGADGRLEYTGELHMYVSQLPCGDACVRGGAPESAKRGDPPAGAGGPSPPTPAATGQESCAQAATLDAPRDAPLPPATTGDGEASGARPGKKRPREETPNTDGDGEEAAKRRCVDHPAVKVKHTGARRVVRQGGSPAEVPTVAPPHTVDTWVYKDFGDAAAGVLRNKPGRGDLSVSMSCSDKIARWSCLGLQGALLGRLFAPVHLTSLTVSLGGSDDPPSRMADLERAVNRRCDGLASHRRVALHATARSFARSDPSMNALDRVMCGYSLAWWPAQPVQDVVTSCGGYPAGATKKKMKTGQAASPLSRRHIFREYRRVAPLAASGASAPADLGADASYAAAKAAAREATPAACSARDAFFAQAPFCDWVRKAPELYVFAAAPDGPGGRAPGARKQT